MKQDLDAFALRNRGRFKVFYTVDKAVTPTWKGDVGFISEKMIKSYLPGPSSDISIYVCGPPGLMKHISGEKTKDNKQGELEGLLKKLGYKEEQVFKF